MAVKNAISRLSGVKGVTINADTGRTTVDQDGSVSREALVEAVKRAGYGVAGA